MNEDKNYWHDKYAPKKHNKGYYKAKYKNTILRDQQYYLDKYRKKSELKTENPKDSYSWDNFRSGEQIIFLIALFIFIISRLK